LKLIEIDVISQRNVYFMWYVCFESIKNIELIIIRSSCKGLRNICYLFWQNSATARTEWIKFKYFR